LCKDKCRKPTLRKPQQWVIKPIQSNKITFETSKHIKGITGVKVIPLPQLEPSPIPLAYLFLYFFHLYLRSKRISH
jgi:hypothetical protein